MTNCTLSFKSLFGGEISYINAESKKSKERERIAEVQRLLAEKGYNPGKPDGIAGSNTEKAIREFQKHRNLPVDGKVTEELLKHLRKS